MNAALYREQLANVPIRLPRDKDYEFHTSVNFVSQCDARDGLQKHLAEKGVQAVVYYNTPINCNRLRLRSVIKRGSFR